ncbi:MAG: hypothetical protein KJ955_01665 [Nanoarchaeota archaeon]|nr:hypothetical protein [Nanoarchaeota archaeon]
MPDTQPQPIQPFDPVLEQQTEQFLKDMDALKVKMLDRTARKEWARDKLKKGFPLLIIEQSLKANNYDFDAVGKYLDNIWQSKQQAEQALKEVKNIKEKDETEKKEKKFSTHIGWVAGAFMLSLIGMFLAIFLQRQTKEIGLEEPGMEMASSMLSNFIKGSWIIAIASGIVTLVLLVMVLAEHFKEKEKKKKEQQAEVAKVQATVQQQMPGNTTSQAPQPK